MLKAAKKYMELGFSIIPTRPDKKPLIKWTDFQNKRAETSKIADQLKRRGFVLDVGELERLEVERKNIQMLTQELQSQRNTRSKSIGKAKAAATLQMVSHLATREVQDVGFPGQSRQSRPRRRRIGRCRGAGQ